MPRYIDTEKTDSIIQSELGVYDTTDLKEMLKFFPTADVAPVVHAKIIIADDGFLRCSACGKDMRYPLVSFNDIAYCSRCGAKIDNIEL